MQTFLPYPSARRSLECLDLKRLGKQRVECLQIMSSLAGLGGLHRGWSAHPAARMWQGYEHALLSYARTASAVWVTNVTAKGRPYADTCRAKVTALYVERWGRPEGAPELPWWWGHEGFHASHRSSLLRKAPDHYRAAFPRVDLVRDDLPYLWPGGRDAEHVFRTGTPVDQPPPPPPEPLTRAERRARADVDAAAEQAFLDWMSDS